MSGFTEQNNLSIQIYPPVYDVTKHFFQLVSKILNDDSGWERICTFQIKVKIIIKSGFHWRQRIPLVCQQTHKHTQDSYEHPLIL